MSNYFELKAGGRELKLVIKSRDHATLDKALQGKNIVECLSESRYSGDPMKLFVKMVPAASRFYEKENGGRITEDDAMDLYDAMIDEGKRQGDIMEVVMGIGEVSGFFPAGTTEAMVNQMQQAAQRMTTTTED